VPGRIGIGYLKLIVDLGGDGHAVGAMPSLTRCRQWMSRYRDVHRQAAHIVSLGSEHA
jgi:hypothetical protein